MPAIRGCGFDENGNYWVEPNWLPQGKLVYLTASEQRTISATAVPTKNVNPNPVPDVSPVAVPNPLNPTAAATAKAQTLQARLDATLAGQVVVTVDKATQGITVSDA